MRIRIIAVLIITVALTAGVVIAFKMRSPPEIETPSSTLYKIPIPNISSYVMANDLLYVVSDTHVHSYNFDTRSTSKGPRIPLDSLLGNRNSQPIVCSWENMEISEPTEIATIISTKTLDENIINQIKLQDTVRPIICSEDIYVVDNYHGSPQRTYILKNDEAVRSELPIAEIDHKLENAIAAEHPLFKDNVYDILMINDKNGLLIITLDLEIWFYQR